MVDFPKPWKSKWNEWDIRVTVLISLLLQMLLIMFASWRRRKASKTFALFIWSTYLLADWVAAFALGLLCNNQNNSDCDKGNQMHGTNKIKAGSIASSKHSVVTPYDDKLRAFWAPFLLLHLGGPDTITAFAMEDNELWPRHLLGLLFEVGAAFYVFLLSVPKNPLLAPTLLMFVAGIIKYGERTYALYRASLDGFRDSMLKDPDPGPNYAKLMEEYAYKMECGLSPSIEISKEPKDASQARVENVGEQTNKSGDDIHELQEAYKFFEKFKGMIVELIFSFKERNESLKAFIKKPAREAFRVVEFELNFVYEVLFTKAVVVHGLYGYMLRVICSCSIMAAFLSFFFMSKKNMFGKVDIAITYTLLVGAICLDALAFVMLILSDWTVVQLQDYPFCKWFTSLFVKVPPHGRWSVTVTQHNLINYCIPPDQFYLRRIMDRPSLLGMALEMVGLDPLARWQDICMQLVDEVQYTWRENVTEALKEHIYEQLKKKAESIAEVDDLKETRRVCSCRGDWALEERGYRGEFGYSVEVEFDESLLLWHIATDLCYYTDEDTGKNNNIKDSAEAVSVKASMHRQFCKLISDYLIYLLVMRPFMMSTSAVIGKIRYRDTCAEAKYFFMRRPLDAAASKSKWYAFTSRTRKEKFEEKQKIACDNLLSVNTDAAKPADVKGDRSKSVLFDACILAKKLKNEVKVAKRWEMMSEVWIEMLAYAASRCPGIAHAQRLSKGGELLTFVWFLMTHLGLGEQYRIVAGHARAKLIVQK
ncbi:hypothetical protein CKAN_02285000 [Cinnamomum micranthum f. kanehirae]|uniref:DUF4220 domain-containing protein n=1 Tax=Cinnamomum micranthum f. kanehirae TaxID=337451 RepID=A0A443PS21_9MAGN|nr:hypothetical protein CKAN_02285000 [Cinnamomum micranthum f. kanehirae]